MTRVRFVYNQLPVNPALHRIFLTVPSSAFCDPLRSSEPGTLPETTTPRERTGVGVEETRRVEMDRGAAMLAVVLDVYEGGKDLIPGWKLKEHAESALATGGIEGLRRYYEACLTGSGHRVKTTLERDRRKTLESEREHFMSIYLGAAR